MIITVKGQAMVIGTADTTDGLSGPVLGEGGTEVGRWDAIAEQGGAEQYLITAEIVFCAPGGTYTIEGEALIDLQGFAENAVTKILAQWARAN